MVGKIKGMLPENGVMRFSGTLHVYYNKKYQTWIARSLPTSVKSSTLGQRLARENFSKVVKAIKQATPEEVEAATRLTRNTPLLVRDALMAAAYGTLLFAVTKDGKVWQGVRPLDLQIQPLLDSISTLKGAMIVRSDLGWVALLPGGDQQVVTFDATTGMPLWADAQGGTVPISNVIGANGVNVSVVATVATVQLTQLAAHTVLANVTGADAIPVGVSMSELLDMLGATRGDVLVRGAAGWNALGIGTAGQVLMSDGTDLSWATPGSGGLITEPSLQRFTATPAQPGFDPVMIYKASTVLSNANKTATPVSGSPYNYLYGTPARFTGKLYFEYVPGATSFEQVGWTGAGGHCVDLETGSIGNFGDRLPGNVGWLSTGAVHAMEPQSLGSPVTVTTVAGWSAGNVLCFALDLDNLEAWLRVGAGNWNNSSLANPATGVGGFAVPMLLDGAANGLIWPGCNKGNTTASTLHLLAADFAQAVPSGFTAWGA